MAPTTEMVLQPCILPPVSPGTIAAMLSSVLWITSLVLCYHTTSAAADKIPCQLPILGTFQPGEVIDSGDPCKMCRCVSGDRDPQTSCAILQCDMPMCLDGAQPVTVEGQCCPSCP